MDAAYDLSGFIVDLTFDDLPEDAVTLAKKAVLDTLANILGGSRDKAAMQLFELVKYWGGQDESAVIAHGGRFPAPNAALVNSTMASALAYHDIHERGHLHATSVVIPSAFAVAQTRQRVDGREFITAICAAIELGCRIGVAIKSSKPNLLMGGWSYGPLLGHFTAAAVSGKLLKLDREKLHNAFGIVYNQAAGNAQAAADAADTEKMGYGFASRNGITASLLAMRGVTGAVRIFDDTETGFYSMYHAGCRKEALLEGLGRKFEMLDMEFKPYPGCRLCHRYFETVSNLMQEKEIKAGEVEEIIPYIFAHEEGLCIPGQEKEKPVSTTAAYFSLPWALACAAVRGKLGISEFSEEALRAPELLKMSEKVHYVLDRSLPDSVAPTKVKIKTKSGALYEANTTFPRGSAQNPLDIACIERKLGELSSVSPKHISEENLTRLSEMVQNLEKVENVADILQLVV